MVIQSCLDSFDAIKIHYNCNILTNKQFVIFFNWEKLLKKIGAENI